MPQAVEVETQPEQQGLAHLHPERATGGASRELALRGQITGGSGTAVPGATTKRNSEANSTKLLI